MSNNNPNVIEQAQLKSFSLNLSVFLPYKHTLIRYSINTKNLFAIKSYTIDKTTIFNVSMFLFGKNQYFPFLGISLKFGYKISDDILYYFLELFRIRHEFTITYTRKFWLLSETFNLLFKFGR